VADSPELEPTLLPPLEEGVDYYIDELGRYVFTEEYHRKRGYCCQNGCKHCPYGFKKGDG
jgi:hypothetical protein